MESGISQLSAKKFAGPITDITVDNGTHAHSADRYLTAVETGQAVAAGLAE